MKKETVPTEVGRRYAEAYDEHYTTKNLHAALEFYKSVVTEHPVSMEAEYSRAQIQNIVRAVVPKEVLYETQLDLALNHVKHGVLRD